MKRTTPQDIEKFDKYVKDWQVRLNLQNWRIERSERSTKAIADVVIMHEDRLATYAVGKNVGQEVTDHFLEQTACHELLHILLMDYRKAVMSGSEEYVMSTEHSIITVLENLLVPKAKNVI
jgi:hypothetical protein